MVSRYVPIVTRIQIQLPDALHARAKRIAEKRETSLAELVRRGLEHMVRLYPDEESEGRWELPNARSLGEFLAPPEDWRELENPSEP
jgi:hypothetical protein